MKMLPFMLLQFYEAAKTVKKAFTQADRALGMKSFTNTISENDALKI